MLTYADAGARIKDGALFRRMSLIVLGARASTFTPRAIANTAAGVLTYADVC
jgi:hypothetical protein